MKKYLFGFIALFLALMIIVPAGAAQIVGTGVAISNGGGAIPIIKAKWETEPDFAQLESGDPTHAVVGSQFNPPCTFNGAKYLSYYSVVTDEEDNGALATVSVDVFHPDGTFKYQVNQQMMSKAAGIQAFKDGSFANLVTYNKDFNYDEVLYELEKGTAAVWVGTELIHYCQPAGDYNVEANAMDSNNNPAVPLYNTFLYVPTACGEFDFDSVIYGNVNINKNVWRAGDTIFDPIQKVPTVRNIGNTDVNVWINQDDMGFGKDSTGKYMVVFDARLGNDGAEPTYAPYEKVVLPDVLERCHLEELDFSIHVLKGSGQHDGEMTLGVQIAAPPSP